MLNIGRRCAVITDSNVGPRYAEIALGSLRSAGLDPVTITVPAGEKSKSLSQAERCFDALAQQRIDRRSFIVALGGGVIGDLAGFVAATWLRGVPFVQVPTTLLAQVDSSVGGKTGVNLKSGKNLVGSFYQPKLVLCDLDTLSTLPEREYRSGLAEVIKYGIIYDARFFSAIERNIERLNARKADVLASVIARCCAIKADVVGQDETESGLRAILNFGHTIGHAIEAISGYGKYLHGEAISIGQVLAARLSVQFRDLPQKDAIRIENLLAKAGLPVSLRTTAATRKKLSSTMKLDKKASAGEAKFVLAKGIGKVEHGCSVPQAAIEEVLS
jgi:3-dehydroquinate synthase